MIKKSERELDPLLPVIHVLQVSGITAVSTVYLDRQCHNVENNKMVFASLPE